MSAAAAPVELRWLLAPESAVPEADAWLAPAERTELSRLRFPRRQRDWRLGRWAARSALGCCADWLEGAPPERLAVLPDADGTPRVRAPGGREPCAISLSHRGGWGLCVLARAGVSVGCDLELVEPRSEAFVADYFTPGEQGRVERAAPAARARVANVIWSAKESAVKALGTGWRVDTRSVEVRWLEDAPSGWRRLRVEGPEAVLTGWWLEDGPRVLTLLADPAPAIPRRLAPGSPGRLVPARPD